MTLLAATWPTVDPAQILATAGVVVPLGKAGARVRNIDIRCRHARLRHRAKEERGLRHLGIEAVVDQVGASRLGVNRQARFPAFAFGVKIGGGGVEFV